MPIVPAKIVRSSAGNSPLIAHVPHASTRIGEMQRALMVLDDEALARELARVTDWRTDHLFSWALELGGSLFINELSRLVFDPERFVEGDPAEAVGQGVVYTHTSTGAPLATITAEERASRIENLYKPYHEDLTALVAHTIERFGVAIILDCHSFPTEPMPTETDHPEVRPDICIGTDEFHTPPILAEALEYALTREGFTVLRNSPFAGTLVPLDYLHKDRHAASVMIEVRRDLYCDEATGEPNERYGRTRALLQHCVDWAVQITMERATGGRG